MNFFKTSIVHLLGWLDTWRDIFVCKRKLPRFKPTIKTNFSIFVLISLFDHLSDILLSDFLSQSFEHSFDFFFGNKTVVVFIDHIEKMLHFFVYALYQTVVVHEIDEFTKINKSIAYKMIKKQGDWSENGLFNVTRGKFF